MFRMVTTVFMLMLLFTSGFSYWDNLQSCIKDEVQEEKESNKINPTVKKLSETLKACNDEMNNDDLNVELEERDKMNDTQEFCVKFNKKLDFDHCFFRGMGWINENETNVNFSQWGEDMYSMTIFMSLADEQTWEKINVCGCEIKDELMAAIESKCNDNHGTGHWYVSTFARCTMREIKAECDMQANE